MSFAESTASADTCAEHIVAVAVDYIDDDADEDDFDSNTNAPMATCHVLRFVVAFAVVSIL